MKDLLDFAREHPWWTLFYLSVIVSAFNGAVNATIRLVRR